MFENEGLLTGWLEMLVEENGVPDASHLTPEMIEEASDDTEASIRNEKLWALGAPTKQTAAMHLDNIEAHFEYIGYLKTFLPPTHDLNLIQEDITDTGMKFT